MNRNIEPIKSKSNGNRRKDKTNKPIDKKNRRIKRQLKERF